MFFLRKRATKKSESPKEKETKSFCCRRRSDLGNKTRLSCHTIKIKMRQSTKSNSKNPSGRPKQCFALANVYQYCAKFTPAVELRNRKSIYHNSSFLFTCVFHRLHRRCLSCDLLFRQCLGIIITLTVMNKTFLRRFPCKALISLKSSLKGFFPPPTEVKNMEKSSLVVFVVCLRAKTRMNFFFG